MTKSLRVAVLSTILALSAAPVFADPGGSDPPPPPSGGGSQVTTAVTAILAFLGY
jgi:hypothetical protein